MNDATESACYDYEKIMQGLDQIENVWKAIWNVVEGKASYDTQHT